MMNVVQFLYKCGFIALMENSVDPDQLASYRASWSGYTLLSKVGIYIFDKCMSSKRLLVQIWYIIQLFLPVCSIDKTITLRCCGRPDARGRNSYKIVTHKYVYKNTCSRQCCSHFFSIYPFHTNGIFLKATYNEVRMIHCIHWGVTGYNFQNKTISSKINFILADSANHDEVPDYAAIHLGLHWLQKYLFRGFWPTKG